MPSRSQRPSRRRLTECWWSHHVPNVRTNLSSRQVANQCLLLSFHVHLYPFMYIFILSCTSLFFHIHLHEIPGYYQPKDSREGGRKGARAASRWAERVALRVESSRQECRGDGPRGSRSLGSLGAVLPQDLQPPCPMRPSLLVSHAPRLHYRLLTLCPAVY